MFAKLVARLFGTRTLTPTRNNHFRPLLDGFAPAPPLNCPCPAAASIRFLPQLESLEDRAVPATNAFLGGNWSLGSSWTLGHVPYPNDDVLISGYNTNDDLTLSMIAPLSSLRIVNGYGGTVTFGTNIWVDYFEMESGAIAQKAAYRNLTVYKDFRWTGGWLNNDESYDGHIYIHGAAGKVAPDDAGTVKLGSTLHFESGSETDFYSGVVELTGGTGFTIDDTSGVNLEADQMSEPFEVKAARLDKWFQIETAGYFRAWRDAEIEIPIKLVGNSELTLRDQARVTFEGQTGLVPIAGDLGSVLVSGTAVVTLENGTYLGADKGMTMISGQIGVSITKQPLSTEATIGADLDVWAGDVTAYYTALASSGPDGRLAVLGNVRWRSGRFNTTIDNDLEHSCFRWTCTDTFTIDNSDTCVVTVDRANSKVTPPVGRKWSVIYGADGLSAPGATGVTCPDDKLISYKSGNPPVSITLEVK